MENFSNPVFSSICRGYGARFQHYFIELFTLVIAAAGGKQKHKGLHFGGKLVMGIH
jgi:hypothetical protein